MKLEAKTSKAILAKVAEGMDVIQAMKEVCGADKVDQMIDDLYEELRG